MNETDFAPDNLPDDVDLLKQMLVNLAHKSAQETSHLETEIKQLTSRLAYLEHKFLKAQHAQFGDSSEQSNQLGLFNEAEATVDDDDAAESADATETETITYQRKKTGGRPKIDESLPRTEIVHDIDDKSCQCCGGELHKMGEDTSEQLEFIPAKVRVLKHIRPKYACRHCEKTAETNPIYQAPPPPSPIPKSIATPSLLAQIICNKYQFALPLHRQEQLFKQSGIDLNKQSMSRWMLRCGELIEPLVDYFQQILLQQPILFADETPIKVNESEKFKSYMWVYGCDFDGKKLSVFDYQDGRGASCVKDYLGQYDRYLQVDGYAAYESTSAKLVGCWAHTRRKFADLIKIQGKKRKAGKADYALNEIGKLYGIEARIKDKTRTEKQQIRQQDAKPILEKLKKWYETSLNQVPDQNPLHKAIKYSLNQWPKLIRYLEDGDLHIDNNRAERVIKPFVIGRKNWLFSDTQRGAKASAILYSLIETAKANKLNPFDYVMYVLEQLAKRRGQVGAELDDLLPWKVKI